MTKEYFRILAPFTNMADVELLKNAGVDELYCGYITKELTKKWPSAFHVLNRRGEGHSFEDYEIFKKAVAQAKKHSLPVYVTINGLYTPEQYPLLLDLVNKVECLPGVKGIIVADLGFLLTLRENNFKKDIHISTGGTVFNSSTADFYHELGAAKVVLPRQLTSDEIINIFENIKSDINIELFIIKEGCGGFIDGFCAFFHCHEKEHTEVGKINKGTLLCPSYNTEQADKGCIFYFSEELQKGHFKLFGADSHKEMTNTLKYQKSKSRLTGCRICDLYDLQQYPIKSLKIIGRGHDSKYIAKIAELISTALSYLEAGDISKSDYRRKCKDLYSNIVLNNKRRCTKYDCYFSSHWVKK